MKRCVRCLNKDVEDSWKNVCEDCWTWREENPILFNRKVSEL